MSRLSMVDPLGHIWRLFGADRGISHNALLHLSLPKKYTNQHLASVAYPYRRSMHRLRAVRSHSLFSYILLFQLLLGMYYFPTHML